MEDGLPLPSSVEGLNGGVCKNGVNKLSCDQCKLVSYGQESRLSQIRTPRSQDQAQSCWWEASSGVVVEPGQDTRQSR